MNMLIVGVGDVTRHKLGPALLRAASENGDLELALTDISEQAWDLFLETDAAAEYSDVLQRLTFFPSDSRELCTDVRSGRFDYVIVATPPQSHVSLVRRYAPFSRVIVEKPAAESAADLIELRDWLDARNLTHYVWFLDHYKLRWGPRWILQALELGEAEGGIDLGEIRSIAYRSLEKKDCWDSPTFAIGPVADGKAKFGYSYEHCPHAFALPEMVLPEAEWEPVSAERKLSTLILEAPGSEENSQSSAVPDTCLIAELSAQDEGARMQIMAAKSARDEKWWSVSGEKATVKWEWAGSERITLTSGEGQPLGDAVTVEPGPGDVTDPYDFLVNNVLLKQQFNLMLPINSAIALLEMLEATIDFAGDPTPHDPPLKVG